MTTADQSEFKGAFGEAKGVFEAERRDVSARSQICAPAESKSVQGSAIATPVESWNFNRLLALLLPMPGYCICLLRCVASLCSGNGALSVSDYGRCAVRATVYIKRYRVGMDE